MGFSRQEYWSGWPFPPPGIFPTQRLNTWQADSLPLSHRGSSKQCHMVSKYNELHGNDDDDGWWSYFLLKLFLIFFSLNIIQNQTTSVGFAWYVLLGWLADLFSKWLWWHIVLIFQKFPENVLVTIYAGELTIFEFLLESIQVFPKNPFSFGCKYYQLVFGVYVLEPWGAHILKQHYYGHFWESVFRRS